LFKFLPVLFLGIIGAEIAVFVAAIQLFGGLAVLSAMLITGIAGTLLLRRQGLKALSSLRSGQLVGEARSIDMMISGTWLALAGLLLVFPGFIADALGILLVIPPIRRFLTKRAGTWFSVRSNSYTTGPAWSKSGQVIEGIAVETPDEPQNERDKKPLIR
jgi:UPF0716 protein FxsA